MRYSTYINKGDRFDLHLTDLNVPPPYDAESLEDYINDPHRAGALIFEGTAKYVWIDRIVDVRQTLTTWQVLLACEGISKQDAVYRRLRRRYFLKGLFNIADKVALEDMLGQDSEPEVKPYKIPMRFKPHVIVDKAEIVLKIPFHLEAKEELKEFIPLNERRWDAEGKAWRIVAKKEYYDFCIELIKKYWKIDPATFTVGGDIAATLDAAIDTTTYYTILGVSANSSIDEIKSAYRKLILKIHPDKGGMSKHFLLVQQAYETLKHPVKKKRYDLAIRLTEPGGGQARSQAPPPRTTRNPFSQTTHSVYSASTSPTPSNISNPKFQVGQIFNEPSPGTTGLAWRILSINNTGIEPLYFCAGIGKSNRLGQQRFTETYISTVCTILGGP